MESKKAWIIAGSAAALVAAASAFAYHARASAPSAAAAPEGDWMSAVGSLPTSGDCLSIRILHDDERLAADGVKSRSTYEDRMVRCEGQVWTERYVPEAVAHLGHDSEGAHAGHHHKELPPLYELAKWVKSEGGKTTLELVSREEKKSIFVPKEEYEAVGFDGNFEAAHSLLRAATRERMTVLRKDGERKLQLLERKLPDQYARVLWSERLELPLRIETGTADGRVRERLEFRIEALAPSAVPWLAAKEYGRSEVSEYRD